MLRLIYLLTLAVALAGCPEAIGGCIRDIKAEPDGATVGVSGVVVADFSQSLVDPCIYMMDSDRSAGIKVYGWGGYEGVEYGVNGITGTDPTGERCVSYTPGPVCSMPGVAKPFYLRCCQVGGGPFHYDPWWHCGQCGVAGCCGLNNIGILVKIAGRVTKTNLTQSNFYIDDGSARPDGSGFRGVRVSYVDWPAGGPYLIPRAAKTGDPVARGDYVSVVGISTIYKNAAGQVQSVIRCRRQSDIRWHYWGSGWY